MGIGQFWQNHLFSLNESITRHKEVVFKHISTFLKERHVWTILNDSMVRNAKGHGPMLWHYGAKTMCITSSSPA